MPIVKKTKPKSKPKMDTVTLRERTFIDLHLAQVPIGEAYKRAGYASKSNAAAQANASRLLRRPRVANALAAESERLRSSSALDRDKVVAFLTDVIMAAPGRLDENSHLVQDYNHTEGELATSTRIRIVDKMAAVKHLTFLLGFDPPKKQEISADSDLKSLLLNLRGGNV